MAFLKVTNLSRQEKENLVVNNISFTQAPLQKIAIAGTTGSGKTSLLKMIAGLIQPSSGEIMFKGNKVIGPHDQLIPHHPGIAYLSQHFELFNNYWVYEILEMANQLSEEEANKIYAICRVEHLLKRRTNELSGGEKQRIALARLLSTAPKLLLLDEPFSNLDAVHKSIIKSVIHDVGEQLQITCMMVSHDALDILSWADTIFIMQDGNIVQQGSPKEVYMQPINEYCAGLLGEYNLMNINGKQLFIRPEQLILVKPEDKMLSGTVQNILFFGSYYLLEVLVDGFLIKVRTSQNSFAIGKVVCLSLQLHDTHF